MVAIVKRSLGSDQIRRVCQRLNGSFGKARQLQADYMHFGSMSSSVSFVTLHALCIRTSKRTVQISHSSLAEIAFAVFFSDASGVTDPTFVIYKHFMSTLIRHSRRLWRHTSRFFPATQWPMIRTLERLHKDLVADVR